MKINRNKANKLSANNCDELEQWADTPIKDTPYYSLLRLLAEMYDSIATGENNYCTLGAVKDGSAAMLTLHLGRDAGSLYAPSLAELSTDAQDLL